VHRSRKIGGPVHIVAPIRQIGVACSRDTSLAAVSTDVARWLLATASEIHAQK